MSHEDFEKLYEKWGGKKILIFAFNHNYYKGTKPDLVKEQEYLTSHARKYNGAFLLGLEPGDGFTPATEEYRDFAYYTWIKNRKR